MNYRKKLNYMFIKMRDPLFGFAVGVITLAALLLYKLGSLVPGLSTAELQTRASSMSITTIVNHPIYLNYNLVQWVLIHFHKYGVFTTRLVSALIAAICVYLVFYTISKWYTLRVAILGTLLFCTSAWFLHIARFATPSVLYLSVISLIAYGTWIKYTNKHDLALFLGVLLAITLLYVPGMVWYLLLGLIWQRKAVLQLIKSASNVTVISSFFLVLLLLPLGWGIYKDHHIINDLLALPRAFPAPLQILKNLLQVPKQLIWYVPSSPETWLDNIPRLNVFLIAMLIVGCYSYFYRSRLDRSKMLAGTLIVASILVGLNGPTFISLLVVPIYLVIAGGVALMLQRWFKVFPKNPLARSIGIIIIVSVIVLSVAFDLKQYFIAWPNSPATRVTYNKHL